MASVSLKNVTKAYPGPKGEDINALRDISLDISEREFVVLTGPPGCGKSSVVRMIAGLEEITKGEILLGDRRMNDVPPKDRDLALVAGNRACAHGERLDAAAGDTGPPTSGGGQPAPDHVQGS